MAVLALASAGSWWFLGAGSGSAAEMERLAVLPLNDLTNDPEQEHLVQGMHSELISEFQQAGVPVIARTSVLPYRDGEIPAREIARELNVDGLVEATVLKMGDSVEIGACLVDPGTEEYVWTATFSGSLREVESLYRDLTRAIAGEIQAALDPEAEARLEDARSVDPRAYEAYLRGVMHAQRYFIRRYDQAIEILEALFEDHPRTGFGRAPLAALDRGAREGGYRQARLSAAEAIASRPEEEYRVPLQVAGHYAAAGREEQAVEWLERAFEARDQNMPYIGVLPQFLELHDRPRFRELARRVGVPLLTGR